MSNPFDLHVTHAAQAATSARKTEEDYDLLGVGASVTPAAADTTAVPRQQPPGIGANGSHRPPPPPQSQLPRQQHPAVGASSVPRQPLRRQQSPSTVGVARSSSMGSTPRQPPTQSQIPRQPPGVGASGIQRQPPQSQVPRQQPTVGVGPAGGVSAVSRHPPQQQSQLPRQQPPSAVGVAPAGGVSGVPRQQPQSQRPAVVHQQLRGAGNSGRGVHCVDSGATVGSVSSAEVSHNTPGSSHSGSHQQQEQQQQHRRHHSHDGSGSGSGVSNNGSNRSLSKDGSSRGLRKNTSSRGSSNNGSSKGLSKNGSDGQINKVLVNKSNDMQTTMTGLTSDSGNSGKDSQATPIITNVSTSAKGGTRGFPHGDDMNSALSGATDMNSMATPIVSNATAAFEGPRKRPTGPPPSFITSVTPEDNFFGVTPQADLGHGTSDNVRMHDEPALVSEDAKLWLNIDEPAGTAAANQAAAEEQRLANELSDPRNRRDSNEATYDPPMPGQQQHSSSSLNENNTSKKSPGQTSHESVMSGYNGLEDVSVHGRNESPDYVHKLQKRKKRRFRILICGTSLFVAGLLALSVYLANELDWFGIKKGDDKDDEAGENSTVAGPSHPAPVTRTTWAPIAAPRDVFSPDHFVPEASSDLLEACSRDTLGMSIAAVFHCQDLCRPSECCYATSPHEGGDDIQESDGALSIGLSDQLKVTSTSCFEEFSLNCSTYTPSCDFFYGPIGGKVRKVPPAPKDLWNACQFDTIRTEEGRKACVDACYNGYCCLGGSDIVGLEEAQADDASLGGAHGGRSCFEENSDVCGGYAPCLLLVTTSSISAKDENGITVPKVPTVDLSKVCSSSNIEDQSGMTDCYQSCLPGSCCGIPDPQTSCFAKYEEVCKLYGPCQMLRASEGADGGPNSPPPKPPEEILDMCSYGSLVFGFKKGLCENMCRPGACCAEDLCPEAPTSNGSDDGDVCNLYAPCQNLAPLPSPPIDLPLLCTDADGFDLSECEDACDPGGCCLATGRSSCFEYHEQGCVAYAPCRVLYKDGDTDGPPTVPFPSVDLELLCSVPGGEEACKDKCKVAECCFESGAGSCFGDNEDACGKYGPCLGDDDEVEEGGFEPVTSSSKADPLPQQPSPMSPFPSPMPSGSPTVGEVGIAILCTVEKVSNPTGRNACLALCKPGSCCLRPETDPKACRTEEYEAFCVEYMPCSVLLTGGTGGSTGN